MYSNPAIFVTTCAKYNAGNSLNGDWLNILDYSSKEDFSQAARELHKDEKCPEFFFTDYKDFPRCYYDEFSVPDILFSLFAEMKERDYDELREEAFFSWLEAFRDPQAKDTAANLLADFELSFQGFYDDEEDFAAQLVNDCYNLDTAGLLGIYFDYAAFARDLFITDYYFDGNAVFSRL